MSRRQFQYVRKSFEKGLKNGIHHGISRGSDPRQRPQTIQKAQTSLYQAIFVSHRDLLRRHSKTTFGSGFPSFPVCVQGAPHLCVMVSINRYHGNFVQTHIVVQIMVLCVVRKNIVAFSVSAVIHSILQKGHLPDAGTFQALKAAIALGFSSAA